MSKGVSGLLLILCAVSLTIMPITITHADKAGTMKLSVNP